MKPANTLVALMLIQLLGVTGCSSFGQKMKAFLGGKPPPKTTQRSAKKSISYNNYQNYQKGQRRQYKKMTRKKMQDEAYLADNTNSLWIMEGQGGYLFAQNIIRMIGDPIPVRIEGDPKDQLVAKVEVINRILNNIKRKQKRALASRKAKKSKSKKSSTAPKPPPKEVAEPAANTTENNAEFNVRTVPSRIVERLSNGSYRIKGSQTFMIGVKEFKTIVTGIVRAEDVSEEGVNSSKLLDSRFDIVTVKRKKKEMSL